MIEKNETEQQSPGREASDPMSDLLCVVTDICKTDMTRATDYYGKYYIPYGDDACANVGALTTQVARKSRFTTEAARYRLKKLAASGVLLERKTPGGTTRWWPVGLAEKLNA